MDFYKSIYIYNFDGCFKTDVGQSYTSTSNAQETPFTLLLYIAIWLSMKSIKLTRRAFKIVPFTQSLKQKAVDTVGQHMSWKWHKHKRFNQRFSSKEKEEFGRGAEFLF